MNINAQYIDDRDYDTDYSASNSVVEEYNADKWGTNNTNREYQKIIEESDLYINYKRKPIDEYKDNINYGWVSNFSFSKNEYKEKFSPATVKNDLTHTSNAVDSDGKNLINDGHYGKDGAPHPSSGSNDGKNHDPDNPGTPPPPPDSPDIPIINRAYIMLLIFLIPIFIYKK